MMQSLTKKLFINADDIEPMITYGTNPGMGIGINGHVPALKDDRTKKKRRRLKIIAIYGTCKPEHISKARKWIMFLLAAVPIQELKTCAWLLHL